MVACNYTWLAISLVQHDFIIYCAPCSYNYIIPTVFIRIKSGLKYTQGLKYTPGSTAEWKKQTPEAV